MTTPSLPEGVLNWLYSSLRPEYRDVQRTYSDAVRTLAAYATLSPRTDVYTYENGTPALLLVLQGTLPVVFRGTTYRFPVAIWVPHAYPYEPPMIYVQPTPDMAVRPGQHVSTEGRVYHPYLAQWASHWDKSGILDFLSVLRDVFAKEPPVVSRTQQTQAQSQPPKAQPLPPSPKFHRNPAEAMRSPPAQQIQGPPPPPKPPEVQRDGQPGSPARPRLTSPVPPPRPPKPGQADGQADMQHQNGHAIAPHTRSSLFSLVAARSPQDGPPPPPLPHEVEGSRPMTMSPDRYSHQPLNQYPVPRFQAPQRMSYPPGPAQAYQTYQQPPPVQTTFQRQPAGQPVPLPLQQQLPPQQQVPQPKPPIQDLLSAPLEVSLPSQHASSAQLPPPPIPPNPEKDALLQAISAALRTQLEHTIAQNQSALPALEAQHAALLAAQQKMQSELDQLQQLDTMLTANEKILHEAMREADRVMETVGQREVPNVDEVLVAPTMVGEQLYGLVADEQGIADAMFALTRALDGGRIGADVFIKQTRSLAREQFLKKALIKKIAKGMGLTLDDDDPRR